VLMCSVTAFIKEPEWQGAKPCQYSMPSGTEMSLLSLQAVLQISNDNSRVSRTNMYF